MEFSAIFGVFSSMWLVVDMALDIVTTEGYHAKAFASGGSAYEPFFWASLGSILLPTAIGSLVCLLACPCLAHTGRAGNDDDDDFNFCVACLYCSPCIFGGCFLMLGIIWVLSPVLHLIQACFLLFGVKPVGGNTRSEIQVDPFLGFDKDVNFILSREKVWLSFGSAC